MKKKLSFTLVCIILIIFKTTAIPVRIIQVKMPAKSKYAGFIYKNAEFEEIFFTFSNPGNGDMVFVKNIEVAPGTIIRYNYNEANNGVSIHKDQGFIVPFNSDSLQFEVDDDHNLTIKSGVKFFIEDAVDRLDLYPGTYSKLDKTFLDVVRGRTAIEKMYEKSKVAIDAMKLKGVITVAEERILLTVAKTDYYYRTLLWGAKNHGHKDIVAVMDQLDKDKEEIQLVLPPGLQGVFSGYFNYLIQRDNIDAKKNREMVKLLLGLKWRKVITAEYLAFSLGDRNIPPAEGQLIYEDIKAYLNGDYEVKLIEISKVLIPKIKSMDQIYLLSQNGKKVSIKQLIDQNPKKLILIDFWASWCKPCREEAPYFEKNKQQFTGKNIIFISISLDEDDKTPDWKQALKTDNLLNASNHFKLMLPKTSPLFKNFKISEIPRYVLINEKGEFLDANFLPPSDPEFIDKLNRLIK